MNWEENTEFPCGLKVSLKVDFGFMGIFGKFEHKLSEYICPIHGKNCKRK